MLCTAVTCSNVSDRHGAVINGELEGGLAVSELGEIRRKSSVLDHGDFHMTTRCRNFRYEGTQSHSKSGYNNTGDRVKAL